MSSASEPLKPFARREKWRLAALGSAVLGLHAVGWGSIFLFIAPRYPFMLGLAGLAYTFGLRHAFDADHIAAIDNTTRKLMRDDARPLGVGFYFSLGHSTVVLLLTLLIAAATQVMTPELPRLRAVGGLVGTAVSGVFLYVIGFVNLAVLVDLVRVFFAMRRGEYNPAEMEARLLGGGLFTRWFGRLFRIVTRPWHMYLVGFLFGLGFDTATEVGLLTTAGVAASQALPLVAVLSLPVVFAAGMSLMDSADGVLMCGAYGWAFSNPLRKVFYNVTVTGLSVVVALFVGTIELVSIVAGRVFDLHGGVWDLVQHLDFQTMGYGVAGLFICSWILSLTVWKLGRFEERWSGVRPPV
jgi:high-affinity nickel-transport protein